jgi:hypothetical protein
MKAAIWASLLAALISASTAATGRERAFRAADPPALGYHRVASQCTFKAPQTSGYRGAAGKRKVCYFDCEGSQAAITIPASQFCAQEQVVLIENPPGAGRSPTGRTRAQVEVSHASP